MHLLTLMVALDFPLARHKSTTGQAPPARLLLCFFLLESINNAWRDKTRNCSEVRECFTVPATHDESFDATRDTGRGWAIAVSLTWVHTFHILLRPITRGSLLPGVCWALLFSCSSGAQREGGRQEGLGSIPTNCRKPGRICQV